MLPVKNLVIRRHLALLKLSLSSFHTRRSIQMPHFLSPITNKISVELEQQAILPKRKNSSSEYEQQEKDNNNSNDTTQHHNKKVKKPREPRIRKKKLKQQKPEPTTPLGILLNYEIPTLLKEHNLTESDILNPVNPILNDPELRAQYNNRLVENVEILKYTSNGDGLAIIDNPVDSTKKQIVVVPFGMPGDIVNIRVFITKHLYVESDLLKIVTGSPSRHDELIRCKYFGQCSGCQYQQIEYADQLVFKQNTIKNAFKYFAPVLTRLNKLPEIGETIDSPLTYGYRTKLTPHYSFNKHEPQDKLPNVGFGSKGKPEFRKDVIPTRQYHGEVMDIEDCIIGTEIIRTGMKNERARLANNIQNVKHKAATILLREDTIKCNDGGEADQLKGSKDENGELSVFTVDDTYKKTCVTDNNAIVSEYVNGLRFDFVANEFFQNNNSILPKVLKYVSDNLSINSNDENYLVDAYCGSGLFSLSIAKDVTKSLGVEISAHSIKFAKLNKKLNQIDNCDFIEGKAEKLFSKIEGFPNDKTSVILDPSRKGCDDVFLNQLSDFYPRKIVYVSCNVHSQARDLEFFVNETANGGKYQIESIRGFDFFPQTHHVESVAVLKRVD